LNGTSAQEPYAQSTSSSAAIQKPRLAAVYFAYYAGVGVSMAYLAPYLRGLGFDGKEIGAVAMAQQSVAVLAALFWGAMGDRIGVWALRFATAGAACALSLLPLARTPVEAGLSLAAASAFSGGIVPLVDAATVHALGAGYSRVRLWGSLGFVCTAQGLGMLLAARGERAADAAMPLAWCACLAATATFASRVGQPARGNAERPRLAEAVPLLRGAGFLFATCALHWAANVPYNLFFGVLVREHGLSSRITGFGMALGVAAEVLALFAFPVLSKRFSLRALFAAAYLLSALRWVLVARADGAAALSALQLFHGATFGLWWACAIESMRRLVPSRLRATGQAVFSAVVFGAGNLTGSFLSGIGYDHFGGASPLFYCAAAVEVFALLPLIAVDSK
jgi:PPP family 3-phenylpropionic acid transporter